MPLFDKDSVGVNGIERRGLDRNRPPVCSQFVGNDLRDDGIAALPHFDLRHHDGHMPIGTDLQPGIEDAFALGGDKVRGIAARPKRPAHHEPASDCRPRQQGSPRNFHALGLRA